MSGATVGVLELQGDFAEHTAMLRACGAKTRGVRLPEDLNGIDGLVIPGGESTTMAKLLLGLEFMQPLKRMLDDGLPVFGTCAGCILMASDIPSHPDQPSIAAIDMSVDRNAYGTQFDSFETEVDISQAKNAADIFNGAPLRAVLIRAPSIVRTGPAVRILASLRDSPIIVQQGNAMATTFHPELTTDSRLHRMFLQIVDARVLGVATAAININE